MELTEFLLARIDEDKAKARYARDPDAEPDFTLEGWPKQEYPGGVVVVGVDRMLAECEAKRRIVEEHPLRGWAGREVCDTCVQKDEMGDPVDDLDGREQCNTLRALAAIYADHPDYREDWRP